MDDNISRQAASSFVCNVYRAIGLTDNQMMELCEGIEALPSAQSEPQWIPCSERMPEEKDAGILKKLGVNKRSDTVLVTVRVKENRITDHACTKDGIWHWELGYAFPDHEVVAWMPLPEPYKVGEKDG